MTLEQGPVEDQIKDFMKHNQKEIIEAKQKADLDMALAKEEK